MELRLTARRGENLLAMIGIPVVGPGVLRLGRRPAVPGRRRLADRRRSCRARWRWRSSRPGWSTSGSPRPTSVPTACSSGSAGRRWGGPGWSPRSSLTVLVVEVAQVVALVAIAWRGLRLAAGRRAPRGRCSSARCCSARPRSRGSAWRWPASLRAEATLTLANALFLAFLLLGGLIVPADQLPEPLARSSAASCRRARSPRRSAQPSGAAATSVGRSSSSAPGRSGPSSSPSGRSAGSDRGASSRHARLSREQSGPTPAP